MSNNNDNPQSTVFLGNCMDYMATLPDKSVHLALSDPPYFDGPQKGGVYYAGSNAKAKPGKYQELTTWEVPTAEYFWELERVSVNQIIWGINYFDIAKPGGRLVWVKGTGDMPFSMAEIAYHSFYNRVEVFNYLWAGYWQEKGYKREKRIHTTQKPVALYTWQLSKFAKPGQIILDTHMGSQSSRIARYAAGLTYYGCELSPEMFALGNQRFEAEKSLPLFDPLPVQTTLNL